MPIESTAIYLGKTMIEAGAEDVGENYVRRPTRSPLGFVRHRGAVVEPSP